MKNVKFIALCLLILLLTAVDCSKDEKYDIRGKWSFTTGAQEHYIFTFSGSSETGTLAEEDAQNGEGDYTVSGETVVFDFTSALIGGKSCHFHGTFTTEDKLSGTMDFVAPYPPFQWTLQVEGNRL